MQEEELTEIYKNLRADNNETTEVEKSTLRSMLMYNGVDREQPEFFRYVNRQLNLIKKATVSKTEFLRIFMQPKIDFSVMNEQETADVFFLLDTQRNGSITATEFYNIYSQTENFQKLSPDKRQQIKDSINQNFRKLTLDGSMTPMEFYKIVKYHEQ